MAKGHQQARSPPGYSLGDLGPTGRDKGEKRLHDPVYVPVSFGVKPALEEAALTWRFPKIPLQGANRDCQSISQISPPRRHPKPGTPVQGIVASGSFSFRGMLAVWPGTAGPHSSVDLAPPAGVRRGPCL